MMADCPLCEFEDTVSEESPGAVALHDATCVCDSCGARFEIDWQDCSTPGKRIPDPDRLKETEFQLRESKPGSHAVVEGGRRKGEYVKLVEDRPYIQYAWACLQTGRVYHYSSLIDEVWETEVRHAMEPD